MKRTNLLVMLFAFLAIAAVPARAADPFAEASVEAQGNIVVGQQISIVIDVYVPNFFTSPPQFPSIDMANAIVTLPDERALNLDKTVNGEQFAGIRRTYLVIPQIAGDYALPSVSIPFGYAKVPGQSTQASVPVPPVTFQVEDVPAQGGGSSFAASNANLTQTLDRNPAELKVGDSLVRTVTLFAEATQAMMLPQPQFDAPEGIKLYRQAPVLTDSVTGPDRKMGSQRSDRVTYVMEKEGKLTIPALNVDWFDTSARQTRHAELAPISLNVKASPNVVDAIPPEVPRPNENSPALFVRALERIAVALVAVFLLGAALYFLLPRLLRWFRAHREAAAQAEPARFRELSLALNSGDAKTAYAALGNWTRAMGFRSVADWAAASGDKTLQGALSTFEEHLFGPRQPAGRGSMRVLASAILAWRVRNRRRIQQPVAPEPALPPLNP